MRFIICVFISFLLLANITAQDSQNVFSQEELKSQFDKLFDGLEKIHPDLYFKITKEHLQEEIEKVKSQIANAMSANQFYFLAAPLISKIGDGHTFLAPLSYPEWQDEKTKIKFLPIELAFNSSKNVFIKKTYDDEINFSGKKLLKINNISIDEIIAKLISIYPQENPEYAYRRLELPLFKYLLYAAYDVKDEFAITIESSGSPQTIKIPGKLISEMKQEPVELYSLKFYNNKSAAYLDVNNFGIDEDDFTDLSEDFFDEIFESNCKNLIIDIRDNPGGNMSNVENLLGYFADSSFVIIPEVEIKISAQSKEQMKQRIPSFIRWLPVQYLDSRGREIWNAEEGSVVRIKDDEKFELQDRRFAGDVYLLINETTYSAASNFAGLIKEFGWGKLIGKETGYPASGGYGEPIGFRLSTTGLIGQVASTVLKRNIDSEISVHGVMPDYEINTTLDDKINEHDTILEAALRLISEKENK